MADHTPIEWADATWNPITGCMVVSPGCTNCYAMRLAGGRLRNEPSRAGLTRPSSAGPVWTGEVRFNRHWLDQPLKWKRPRRIFVCAHGDLFHEAVPNDWIDEIFTTIGACDDQVLGHEFLVLTKRSARQHDYMRQGRASDAWNRRRMARNAWPPSNIWLGVSVEDQRRADERIPELLATPAAVRFVSYEPALSPVVLPPEFLALGKRAWAICGGESGAGARPMLASWARSLRDQCTAAGVPFFFKQWGEWIDADEWFSVVTKYGAIMRDDRPWLPELPLNYGDATILAEITGRGREELIERHSDGTTMIRAGKRAAGRLLDGREWSEFPAGPIFTPEAGS